jgi:uncharacterized protein (DUF2147 family)
MAAVNTRRSAATALVVLLAMHAAPSAWAADSARIEGRWLTFDDQTKARRSLIEVVRDHGKVTGRIVELYPKPGEDPDPVCENCPGKFLGRKIRGLDILQLEADDGGARFRGSVLDPEEGAIYECRVTLSEDGKRLVLRGFVGLPILGRTETWIRSP